MYFDTYRSVDVDDLLWISILNDRLEGISEFSVYGVLLNNLPQPNIGVHD